MRRSPSVKKIVGLALLGAAAIPTFNSLIFYFAFDSSDPTATGTVVSAEVEPGSGYVHAQVEAILEGERVVQIVPFDPGTEVHRGDTLEVTWMKGKPSTLRAVQTDYFALVPVVAPASIGLVLALVGAGFLLRDRKERAARAELREKGREVKARFLQVDRDHAITVNGQPAWVVVAEHQDPFRGGTRFYRSEPLWNDPTAEAARQPYLRVFVDPEDPGRYEMDLDFLG